MNGTRRVLAIALGVCLMGLTVTPAVSASYPLPDTNTECERKSAGNTVDLTQAFLDDGDEEQYADDVVYEWYYNYALCEFAPM